MQEATDTITFNGHQNVRATHKTTLEVTREPHLTTVGNCIVGVKANKACSDLQDGLRKILKSDDSMIEAIIEIEGESFHLNGEGSSKLSLRSEKDMVFRTSAFICTRTVAIHCSASAADLPGHMVELLRDTKTRGKLIISARL
jgi:hypothetical protein